MYLNVDIKTNAAGVQLGFFERGHKSFENLSHHGWPTKDIFDFWTC